MIRSISALIFYIAVILGILMVCQRVYIIKKFIYTFGSKKPTDSRKSFSQSVQDWNKGKERSPFDRP
ncbi:hypothetical protein ES703_90711 [subsurface metagenome]